MCGVQVGVWVRVVREFEREFVVGVLCVISLAGDLLVCIVVKFVCKVSTCIFFPNRKYFLGFS